VEAEAWCARCGKATLHRVDHPVKGGGRLGPCIDPNHPVQELSKAQQKRRDQEEKDKREPKLF
jgi:hypothetical protein